MKRLVRLHLHCTLHTDKQTVINVLKILTVKSSFYTPTLRKKKENRHGMCGCYLGKGSYKNHKYKYANLRLGTDL